MLFLLLLFNLVLFFLLLSFFKPLAFFSLFFTLLLFFLFFSCLLLLRLSLFLIFLCLFLFSFVLVIFPFNLSTWTVLSTGNLFSWQHFSSSLFSIFPVSFFLLSMTFLELILKIFEAGEGTSFPELRPKLWKIGAKLLRLSAANMQLLERRTIVKKINLMLWVDLWTRVSPLRSRDNPGM